MSVKHFSVAKDFSLTPGPRHEWEGPHSGELLNRMLRVIFEQVIAEGCVLEVDLDGTAGFATSFLEAVFGGLARTLGRDVVKRHLRLISDEEPYLVDEIMSYINEATEPR